MATPKKKKTTLRQTGLTITRSGNTFTHAWKIPQAYTSQSWFYLYYTSGKANYNADLYTPPQVGMTKIGGKVTSVKSDLDKTKFYPTTALKLTAVELEVWGEQGTPAADYTENMASVYKKFNINIPKVPTLTRTPSTEEVNTCAFTWNAPNSTTDSYILTDVEYQSILVANSTETDGSKLSWKTTSAGWRTGTGGATGTINIAEQTADIASGSHTRWFRVRSRGPAGASAWKYAKRVYAAPYAPKIKSTKATTTSSGYDVLVTWDSAANAAFPALENDLEYLRTVPGANLTVPVGATFTKEQTTTRASVANAGTIDLQTTLGPDEVVFARVIARNITEETESAAALAVIGTMTAPEITNVAKDSSNYSAVITATNRSSIPGSFLVVTYRTGSKPKETSIVGIIPAGQTQTTVRVPNWSAERSVAFGAYAVVGSYTNTTKASGLTSYSVTARMRSQGIVWETSTVPKAPTQVTASRTDEPGRITVSWNWPWAAATKAVLSWSDDPDAWQSTNEPETYEVENAGVSQWTIPGLTPGKKYYIRVRLVGVEDGKTIDGPWSNTVTINLATAPLQPVMNLSASRIASDGSVDVSWTYQSTDTTPQEYAQIKEVTISGQSVTYGRTLATAETDNRVIIFAEYAKWLPGTTHYIAVRVRSGSGRLSAWSDPVPVKIAQKPTAAFASTNLVDITEEERTFKGLRAMPLTAQVTGAGAGGKTTLIIERAEDYQISRPNELQFNGYAGETIAVFTQTGETQITITGEDLLGRLDEGAKYNLIGVVEDGLGQTDSIQLEFEPKWSHQATKPEGTATIFERIALITPTKPEGWQEGDTCDIYRLSADLPELVYEGAEFNETYVDPFPAIGQFGGHRLVYKTKDGDYITEDNEIAWLDLIGEEGASLDIDFAVLDFLDEEVFIRYNMSIDNSWEKDFIETKYLGGSITGDWNQGVKRTGSLNAVTVTTEDPETIRAIRRLAAYAGLCHLRTPDGSSYPCNVDVSDNMTYSRAGKVYDFSLTITKIDPQGYEGMTLEDYTGGESE